MKPAPLEILKANLAKSAEALKLAETKLEAAKARHRQSLVNGTAFDRATLAAATQEIMEARERHDGALAELEGAEREAIQKAAQSHTRRLQTHITQILSRHPEVTA